MFLEVPFEFNCFSVLLLSIVLLLVIAVSHRQYHNTARYSHKLPPSPGIALPFIGHLYMLPKNPRKQMMEWAKRLGPVFHLQFGCELVVVLNGFDTLKEALVVNADYFSGRPKTFVTNALGKDRGFVTSGPQWSQQRKVSMHIFRQLGFGSPLMEEKIQTEVTLFLTNLELQQGAPFNPRDLSMQCISNVISRMVFGKGFRHDDPNMAHCARLIGEQVSLMEGLAVLNFLPVLRHLPGDLFGLKKVIRIADQLESVLTKQQIAKRKNNDCYKEGEVEDYVTGYLREIDKEKDSPKSQQSSAITEENLISVVANLFAAGTETTSTTICWSILYLLHYPRVKEQCFQEIVTNIGLERPPCGQDRYKCKYMEAFLMEVQRIASIAPFSLFHVASDNVIFRGSLIPKGAIIMPSLDSVLLSEEIWGDPFNFRPERFLDSKTNELIRRPELVPYSLGKRSCLGEALAKLELFLFITSILQNYDIKLPDGETEMPPLFDRFGLSCSPLPYEVCFVSRSKSNGH